MPKVNFNAVVIRQGDNKVAFDLNDKARVFFADAIDEFNAQLKRDENPSVTLSIGGAEIEIRLNKADGVFDRQTVIL